MLLVVTIKQVKHVKQHGRKDAREEQEELQLRHMRFEGFLGRGCVVADRTYEYFATKDPGKTANRDDGGRDKETVYFLATQCPRGDAERAAASFLGSSGAVWKSIEEGWRALASFTDGTKSVAKMAARLELAFSGTTPVFDDESWHVHRDLKVHRDGAWPSVIAAAAEADRRRPKDDRGINVIEVDDIYGAQSAASSSVETETAPPPEMTDGTGLMSLDLAYDVAHKCGWFDQSGTAWLLQARIWYDGSLGKGTLLASAQLPPRTICLRTSQVKVESGTPGHRMGCKGSLEIVRRQHSDANLASLGTFLVPLLEYGGGTPMVDALLRMQKSAAKEMGDLRGKVSRGNKLTADEKAALLRQIDMLPEREDGLASSTQEADLLFAGFDGRDEYVRTKVLGRLNESLLKLAQGKFSIPDSCSLMVTADPTSSIPEGCVVCLLRGVSLVRSRVLLYKSPGMHPGDVRSARAIEMPPELAAHLRPSFGDTFPGGCAGQTCLIFSSRGSRPLADMIAGSDYDGDVFTVIYNEEMLSHWRKEDVAPWTEPSPSISSPAKQAPPSSLRPASLSREELRAQLRAHLFHCRKANNLMGSVATSWKQWVHDKDVGCPEAISLSWLYMQALDAGKASALPMLPQGLRRAPWEIPYHLKATEGGRAVQVDSHKAKSEADRTSRELKQSGLLQLWNAVATDSITGIQRPQTCPALWTDEDLHVYVYRHRDGRQVRERLVDENSERWRRLLHKWKHCMDSYSQQVKNSCTRNGGSFDSTPWKHLIHDYRSMMLGAGRGAGGENLYDPTEPSNELRLEASALYHACYLAKANQACGCCQSCVSSNRYERKLTFPWAVAGDILRNLKIHNHEASKPGQKRAPMAVDREVLVALQRRQRQKADSMAERMAMEEAEDEEQAPNAVMEQG